MNWPKPLLPSKDRDEYDWKEKRLFASMRAERFAKVFISLCILTGFALIALAYAFYS